MPHLDADVIIIGSGSGGLSAAIALVNAGKKVIVLEQHSVPGGWCHNFKKGGYTFSPGVHYIGRLGPGDEARDLYEGLGVANDLIFFELNPEHYEHCHIAGTHYDYHAHLPTQTERLIKQFPKERTGIESYMKLLQDLIFQLPIIFQINSLKDIILMPYRTRHIGRYGLYSLKRIFDLHISDPVLRGILSIQCGDQGLPPSKTMMMLHAGLARHYEHGGYYPRGGGGAIANAETKKIREKGSSVILGTQVQHILTEKNGRHIQAIGVKLSDGSELRADHIISNTDPHKTFEMVGENNISRRLKKRLNKTRYSLTSLLLFLAVDMDLQSAGHDSGNIWYTNNPDFDHIYEIVQSPDLYDQDTFPSLFISIPTLKDPTKFDGYAHTLEVVTYVGYDPFKKFEDSYKGHRSDEYKRLKQTITNMFLNTIEKIIPGIKRHIQFCDLGTPLTNSHYINSTNGCVYGTEKRYSQIGPMSYRVGTEIKNLQMVGASTVTHGVYGAALSGLHSAASIMDCSWPELLNPEGQKLQTYPSEDQSQWPEWLKKQVKQA